MINPKLQTSVLASFPVLVSSAYFSDNTNLYNPSATPLRERDMARQTWIWILFLVASAGLGGGSLAWAQEGDGVTVRTSPAIDTNATATDTDADAAPTDATAVTDATDPAEAFRLKPGDVGWIKLTGTLRSGPPPFAWAGSSSARPSLRQVVNQLDFIANSPKLKGLVIHLDQPQLDRAHTHELTLALARIRAAGKKVLVYSETYEPGSYLLACAADRILLQHDGMVMLTGIGVEELYLTGLLEKLGLKADFVQVGKYKGADEQLTRRSPSPEWSQTMDGLLDSLYEQMLDRIMTARGMDRAKVVRVIADCWSMCPEDYVQSGLIDELVSRDLLETTAAIFGEAFNYDQDMGQTPALLQTSNPLLLLQQLMADTRPAINRPTLAVIHAEGPITSGKSTVSGGPGYTGLFGGPSIGSETMVDVLDEVRDNDLIKGVVIRIDSPGGSAIASEMIWQAVRELDMKKPVYISIGSMAASGGYYIACGGRDIYASPGSIVGSIGVVGGKIIMGDLYKKLGIEVHRRNRGPMADMFNSVEPFTREQRQALASAFERTYKQFVDRVKRGRGIRIEDVSTVAQGRIFSGLQARKNGLVDKIGGLEMALVDLAEECKLDAGTFDIIDLPEPMTLPEYIESIFGADAAAPSSVQGLSEQAATVAVARAVLGPRAWRQAAAVLSGIMQLRHEHVLTLMPVAVDVR